MIKLAITIAYNFLLLVLRKIRYGHRYDSHCIERFSSGVTIKLFKNGRIKLGRNIELAKKVDIQVHGNGIVEIGASTYMNRYCMVSCHSHVSIGAGCMFGPSVKIFDNNHKFSSDTGVSSDLSIGEISVGDNCWIASNVILLKGACIGDNCVIGAGCVINTSIPAGSIVKLHQSQIIENIK